MHKHPSFTLRWAPGRGQLMTYEGHVLAPKDEQDESEPFSWEFKLEIPQEGFLLVRPSCPSGQRQERQEYRESVNQREKGEGMCSEWAGSQSSLGVLGSSFPEVLAGVPCLRLAGKPWSSPDSTEQTWAPPWGSADTNCVQRKLEGGALSPLGGQLCFCSHRSLLSPSQGSL